jgi:hypothetical protein
LGPEAQELMKLALSMPVRHPGQSKGRRASA